METEAKSSESVEVPTPMHASKWRTVQRLIKYLTLGFLGAAIILTIVTWARSYSYSDRVQGTLGGSNCFMIGSTQGCIACVAFDSASLMPLPREFEVYWAVKSYPLEHPMAYPNATVINDEENLKIGLIRQVDYTYWSNQWIIVTAPGGRSQAKFQGMTLFLNGGGVLVPHWLILLVSATLFALILRGRKFTLRAFMIWLTLVCVLLGCAMRIETPIVQPNWKFDEK